MKRCKTVLYLILIISVHSAVAQVSADCTMAVPICNNTPVNGGTNGYGIDDFNSEETSGCLRKTVATDLIESNSAWYHFKTGASGQLGFNIGFDSSEDWDFALYKTNDCSNLGDPIRCNFFDNTDENSFAGVGEDPTGDKDNIQYGDWLQVASGEDYYLLINNFSNINTGFSIQFSGNIFITNPNDALDCSIISNLLGAPIVACENETVILDANTIGASTYEWFRDNGNGFAIIGGETNAILDVSLLGSALYRVRIDNTIVSDVQVAFSENPITYPIANDTFCSGLSFYDLSQKDKEALGVQSPNDFMVSYYSSPTDAVDGTNPLPKLYAKSIGLETIYVRTAPIKNPKCFDVSQQFELLGIQTPELNFPLEVYLCEGASSVTIGETMPNPNYTYEWDNGESTSSIFVDNAGVYTVTVTNNEGIYPCEIKKEVVVFISNTPEITDVLFDEVQTNNTVTIITAIQGNYLYKLDDGDFQDDNIFYNILPGMHNVMVNDLNGCGNVTETIVVVGFLKFFTPNGDGYNDKWGITGMAELETPAVFIYDSFGKLLKQLNKNGNQWNGTFNGLDMPSSDYWFKLTYIDYNGQRRVAKYIDNHFALKR